MRRIDPHCEICESNFMFVSTLIQNISSALTGRKDETPRGQAAAIYSQLMRQARNPWFYTEAAVPDSLDGRFEILVLHLFGFIEPRKHDDSQSLLRQALMEFMLDDMDRTLREMGVGDMGVSRRIKQMGNALHGRLQNYAAALQQSPAAIEDALKRNAYGTVPPELVKQDAVVKLASYLAALPKYLAAQQHNDLKLKYFSLPD